MPASLQPKPAEPFHTRQPEPADPGFGIYVHWPFCLAKCPYCDFNSHVRREALDQERFARAYLAELDHMAELTGARKVDSVFFGGGTPSLMAPKTVAAILERIARNWSLGEGAEITIEANPTSVEAAKFAGYRAAGVNRLSLGVQALDDKALKGLGRLHSAAEALEALAIAKAHFARISFDLIYARPDQSGEAWAAELGQALAHEPTHMSLYQLTIEPGTPFAALHAAGKLAVPESDHAAALYEITQALTDAAGLPAYEVSNHAAPGEECRHNLTYWRYGDYAGVGPGAHGRLTIGAERIATSTMRAPEAWAARVADWGHGIETSERLSNADQRAEFLLMGLRLREGVDLARFEALGGRPAPGGLRMLKQQQLIEQRDGRLAVTDSGRLVLNAVIAELAPELASCSA